MKIEFVTPSMAKQVGGLEKAIARLREALRASGLEVGENGDLEGADVVHFHGLWEPSFASYSRRLRKQGRAYAVTPHGMLEPWAFAHKRLKKSVYFRLLEKSHLAGANVVFSTGRMESANLAHRLGSGVRIETIAFGADTPALDQSHEQARKELGVGPGDRLLVFLSRLDHKKGLDLLLNALADMGRSKTADWRLFVVGDGPAESTWREQAKCLSERLPPIEWRGAKWGDEKWLELVAADLFCLPTRSENFGFAVQEALGVGSPVMTTTETPWEEFEGLPGLFLCEPNADSIREALLRWDTAPSWNASDREELSDWTANTFDWETVAKRYSEVYRSLSSL